MAIHELLDDPAYVLVKVQAAKRRLLTSHQYMDLTHVEDVETFTGTIEGMLALPAGTLRVARRVEMLLHESFFSFLDRLLKNAPGPWQEAGLGYLHRFWIENLKNMFIGKLVNAKEIDLKGRVFWQLERMMGTERLMNDALRATSMDEALYAYRKTGYRPILRDALRRYEATGELFFVHALLDKHAISFFHDEVTMNTTWAPQERAIMMFLVSTTVDTYNTSTVVRGRNNGFSWEEVEMFIVSPGGKLGKEDLKGLFEADPAGALDAKLKEAGSRYREGRRHVGLLVATRPVHSTRVFYFNTHVSGLKHVEREPGGDMAKLLAFMLRKEVEIENITTILESIKNGLEPVEMARFLTLEA